MTDRAAPETSAPPPRRSFWTLVPFLIFAVVAAMFGFALTTGDPSKLPSALIGRPVPVTEFPALEGLKDANGTAVAGFASGELGHGRVSVVNFWASWCTPCIEEHPLLIELGRQTGVDIYGVNCKDRTEAARRFLGRYGNPFRAVGIDGQGRGAIEWGVYGMPETFVVGADGTVAYKHVGPISKDSLAAKLVPAIERAKAAAAK